MRKLLLSLLFFMCLFFSVGNVSAQSLDLSPYSAMNMNVYQNSRVTSLKANTNGTFTVSGYMFNDSNCNKANSLYREIIFVNANDTSTAKAYRQEVKSEYNPWLNKNMNATQNGKYDLSYANYSVTVNPKAMLNYAKTSTTSMVNGEYLVYMRISDGKTSYLFPLKDITLSDGTNMENTGTLPAGFEVISQETRELCYIVTGSSVTTTTKPTTSTPVVTTKPSTTTSVVTTPIVHKYTDVVTNVDSNKVANQIISQVKAMNDFMYNSYCGFPYNNEYDAEFDGVRGYIIQIIKSMTGKWKITDKAGKTVEEIHSEARYAIFNMEQYDAFDKKNGEYSLVIKEWMKDGHPSIDTIDSITFAKVNNSERLDNYSKDLVAYVTSKGIEYEVSLHKEGSNYKVIDIDRLTMIRESMGSPNDYYNSDWLWDDPTLLDDEIVVGSVDNTVVTFADKNLEITVREMLNKQSGNITANDVLSITMISVYDKKISNISGLEHFKNLKFLYLQDGNISDLTPLTGLTKLTEISLFRNNISDITPLASLKNLEYLNLSFNKISSISALSNLTNLKELYLLSNNISNIDVITKMANLTDLNLEYNRIQNVPSLSSLIKLDSLSLSYNQISNISELGKMGNLRSLYLDHNKITDISALSNNTNLEWLGLSENNISDIAPLKSLTNMKSLYINNTNISDIGVLYNMPKLSVVWMDNTKVSETERQKFMNAYPKCVVRY